MKISLLALLGALFLTSCAGVKVDKTYVATGAAKPSAIYIRPFDISEARFAGRHGNTGAKPIRKSQAPRLFAQHLKEELSQIAPAMVIENDEMPTEGWLIEGEFDLVHGGSPFLRHITTPFGVGRSEVNIHVKVIEINKVTQTDTKKAVSSSVNHEGVESTEGTIIYSFDLDGGSRMTGKLGSVTAPGIGDAINFDFRNAAERVKMTLDLDPHRYGVRTSPTIR